MKVTMVHMKSGIHNKDFKLYDNFIKFLQKHFPLKENITVILTGEKIGKMTTGKRDSKSRLFILSKGRLNRDILRTIAHEWVHEYQMKILNRKKGPNIGGQNEDEANSLSGSLVKKFEKLNPDLEKSIYS